MDTRVLQDRTEVYQDVFTAEPLSWPVAAVEQVHAKVIEAYPLGEPVVTVPLSEDHEIEGLSMIGTGSGFAPSTWMTADSLPIEFFSHQLFDYDPFDKEDVSRFVSEWGMPFSPQRNATFCLKDWGIVWQYAQTGIAETWNLEEALTKTDTNSAEAALIEKLESGELSEESLVSEVERLRANVCIDTIGNVISSMEASTTLFVLQETVRTMLDITESGGWVSDELDRALNVLYAGSCNPRTVLSNKYWYRGGISNLGSDLRYRGQLTSAICNQIIEAVEDTAPWRKCACEGCGRIFKRKQSKSGNPDSDSIYCSDKCMERQKKRNQRSAAKNRAQH